MGASWKFQCFFIFLPPSVQSSKISPSISIGPNNRIALACRPTFHPFLQCSAAPPLQVAPARAASRSPPPAASFSAGMAAPAGPTRLAYFDDMWALRAPAAVLSVHQEEGGRRAVVLDATIFHPQGGGQPADTGVIVSAARFLVEDVRVKDGVVFHYGRFEDADGEELSQGQSVSMEIDADRRKLNSRLHSAGHLLDSCMTNLGLHMEPGKGYHFPDGPFVEYKGVVPTDQLQDTKIQLEKEANELISKGAKVLVSVFPYEEAAKLCGGALPSYISEDSTPRIVKFGDCPGCPCGGTHVADITDIGNLKVTNIRVKKGVTKVSYSISP
ncbi:alanyl-tRNA synthetase [Hordeum vulgare]|nr:alanyl-tRNA synthetase [Hordeum vulgare]